LLAQVTLNAVMLSANYILLAVGMSLVFGVLRVVNLAHGAFYMIGAFVLYYMYVQFGLPYGAALMLVAVLLFMLGVMVDRLTLNTTRGKITIQFLIMLGVMYVLDTVVLLGFGYTEKAIPPIVSGVTEIGGTIFANSRLAPTVLAIVFVTILFLFMQYTRQGKAIRAVSQNREAAALQGINVNFVFALAFGIGAALAGIAGALLAPMTFVHPFMGQPVLWKSFTIVIIGGLGRIQGAVAGGIVLGLIDSFMATYVGGIEAQVTAFAAVILILLVRPQGLIGREKLWKD
jgi:branched-chain amino acid transport system permease protein